MAHDRAFLVSLVVSAVFHLSMVTVFSVVIFFPRHRVDYYSFSIIRPETGLAIPERPRDILRVPSPATVSHAEAVDAETQINTRRRIADALPKIDLPTVEFAELRRLEARQKGLALRARRSSSFDSNSDDSWARFGRGLGRLRTAIGGLGLLPKPAPEPVSTERPAGSPVTRPATGFEAHIEWITGSEDRRLLFAPPIKSLWATRPQSVKEPIVLEFTVNPEGRVISVWTPKVDDSGVITDAQNTLLKYRFDPIDGDHNQNATLHIVPSAEQ